MTTGLKWQGSLGRYGRKISKSKPGKVKDEKEI